MTVNEIFEFLNNLYPTENACDFDNVGILIGDKEKEVKKALVSLDCTLETVEQAFLNDCQLIITHHPVIFDPLKNIHKGDVAFKLIERSIAVISMHTNLDVGNNGVNDCLCNDLGLENIKPYKADDGYLLKCGEISKCSADELALLIKQKLNTRVKFIDGGKEIENVLVCSGSGGSFLTDAINGEFDALITADVKHSQFLEARDKGISLFDGGHFETEDVVIEPLKKQLQSEFKEILFFSFHKTNIKYL